MAFTAGAAAVGVTAAAAAAAAAIKANRINAQARNVKYGGSQEAQDELKKQFAGGIDQGNGDYSTGVMGLGRAGQAAQGLAAQGQQLATGPDPASTYRASQGSGILGSYTPGGVAAAQQQQALEQGALQNVGAARSGGALGLRNALVANAGANVQAAGQAATQRAQEQQAYLGQQMGLATQEQQQQMQALQFGQQQGLQQKQVGLGAQQSAIGMQGQFAGQQGVLGLGNQQQYLSQQQNVYDSQNANDLAYEKARQEEAQRKSDRWWQAAGGAMGIAGKAFGMGSTGG